MRSPLFSSERSKAIAFVVVWLVLLTAIAGAIEATNPDPPTPSGIVHSTLDITAPAWSIHYVAASQNNTVFRLLREAGLTLRFELDWVEYGWPYNDVLVTSINATRGGDVANHWWQYCVNEKYAEVGAATHELRDGDRVVWAYAPAGGSELCQLP